MIDLYGYVSKCHKIKILTSYLSLLKVYSRPIDKFKASDSAFFSLIKTRYEHVLVVHFHYLLPGCAITNQIDMCIKKSPTITKFEIILNLV